MSWKRYLKNLFGWVGIAVVCFMLYELFGLMFAIVGAPLAAFVAFDVISRRSRSQ